MMLRTKLTSLTLQVRVMVVGLGAGMLPMFLHNHLPFDEIKVSVSLPVLTVEKSISIDLFGSLVADRQSDIFLNTRILCGKGQFFICFM